MPRESLLQTGGLDDESAVADWRTSGSLAGMASEDDAAERQYFRPSTSATRRTSDDRYPEAVPLTNWNISVAKTGMKTSMWEKTSWEKFW